MTAFERTPAVLKWIDQKNSEDPRTVLTPSGETVPREVHFSKLRQDMLFKICSKPSDALHIAVYGQHICRWQIPREQYPADREGYLQWRKDLQAFHADILAKGLKLYDESAHLADRVGQLVRKEKFKSDPEGQTLEDVSCLVFLMHEFETFAASHDRDKLIPILQKTWKKMSPDGRAYALECLPGLPAPLQHLIKDALS